MSKKILVILRHSGYLRLFQPVLKRLIQQGHEVILCFPKFYWLHPESSIKEYFGDCSNLRYSVFRQKKRVWDPFAKFIRLFQNYLRYLEPNFNDTPKLRARAGRSFHSCFKKICELIFLQKTNRIWLVIRFLRRIERLIPVPDDIIRLLNDEKPDVSLIAPFVELPATQMDWLKAMHKLEIPTGLWIASWDNLTSKGLVQMNSARVIVWNNFQKDELINLHKIDEKYVAVTGAQCYDWWFDFKPKLSQEEFCSSIGISIEKKYVLYLGSSPFIFENEYRFVDKWLQALTKKGLNDFGVLIRPHPQNYKQWDNWDGSKYPNVVIFPKEGANPIEAKSRSDYFHSLYYCSAVVGVNTSAMIESGILSKPVFTVETEMCNATQSGTLHFRYLRNNGLLEFDSDLDSHAERVVSFLRKGSNCNREKQRKFVGSFVRPHGLDKPATDIVVDEILKISSHKETFLEELSFIEKWVGKPFIYVFSLIFHAFFNFNKSISKKHESHKERYEKKPL